LASKSILNNVEAEGSAKSTIKKGNKNKSNFLCLILPKFNLFYIGKQPVYKKQKVNGN